jgi:hypothetical protein
MAVLIFLLHINIWLRLLHVNYRETSVVRGLMKSSKYISVLVSPIDVIDIGV